MEEKKKITSFFKRKENNIQDQKSNNTTVKPTNKQPVNENLRKVKPKIPKVTSRKANMEEEKKKARGYWIKLAETKKKQEEMKCENKKPPDLKGIEQAHCKSQRSESGDNPCTPVQPGTSGSILEHSNLRHVLCESEINKKITLGIELTGKVINGGLNPI